MTRAQGLIVVVVAASVAALDSRGKDQVLPKSEMVKDADPAQPMQAGQTRQDNGLKMTSVWAPPGRFRMGTPLEKREQVIVQRDEGPVEVE